MLNSMDNITNKLVENSTQESPENIVMKTVSLLFGIQLTLILCIFGTIGNTVCIVVLTKVIMWGGRCPLFLILIALAASDNLVLILNFTLNIVGTGYPFTKLLLPIYQNHGKLIMYLWPLLMAFQTVSIYLTVVISYERWLAVCRPLQVSKRCSMRRLSNLILGILLLSILYNSPRWWEYDSKELPFTDVLPHHTPLNITVVTFVKSSFGLNILYRYCYCAGLYALVMFILPFVAITAMNVALVRSLRNNKKKWLEISRSQRKEVKLTYVPLAIVGLFYIFGMPAVVANLIDSLMVEHTIPTTAYQAYVTVSNFCVVLNSAINFVIYCLLGEKFRATLLRLCGCARIMPRHTWQTETYRMNELSRRNFSTSTIKSQREVSSNSRALLEHIEDSGGIE